MEIKLYSFANFIVPLFKGNVSRSFTDHQKKILALFLTAVGIVTIFVFIRRSWNKTKVLNKANDQKVKLIKETVQKREIFPSQPTELKKENALQKEAKTQELITLPVHGEEQLEQESKLEKQEKVNEYNQNILDQNPNQNPKPVLSFEATTTLDPPSSQTTQHDLKKKNDEININHKVKDLTIKEKEEEPQKEELNKPQESEIKPQPPPEKQGYLASKQESVLIAEPTKFQPNDETRENLNEKKELKQEIEQPQKPQVIENVINQEPIPATELKTEDIKLQIKPCDSWNEVKSYLEKHQSTKMMDVNILEAIAKHFANQLIPRRREDLKKELQPILADLSKFIPTENAIDSESESTSFYRALSDTLNLSCLVQALNDFAREKLIQENEEKIPDFPSKEIEQELKKEDGVSLQIQSFGSYDDLKKHLVVCHFTNELDLEILNAIAKHFANKSVPIDIKDFEKQIQGLIVANTKSNSEKTSEFIIKIRVLRIVQALYKYVDDNNLKIM